MSREQLIKTIQRDAILAVERGMSQFMLGAITFIVEQIGGRTWAITLAGSTQSLVYVQQKKEGFAAIIV